MINTILFDFGGVYIESPFKAIAEVAVEMGLPVEFLQKIIFGDYHADSDHPWHQLERGEISLEHTRDLIILEGSKHGLKTDIYEMLARFAAVDRGILGPLVDKTIEWKGRGYKIGMITNNIKEFTSWRSAFPFVMEDIFDVIADSSALGVRKPNAAIYQYALNQLNVEPGEALFLDDYPANIAAANALGLRGFIVKGPVEKTIEWVERQLASQ